LQPHLGGARPSLEGTKTQLQNAVKEITTAATQLLLGLTWDNVHGDITGNCEAPYGTERRTTVFPARRRRLRRDSF